MKILSLSLAISLLPAIIPITAKARPVSYPGGWTLIQNLDAEAASLLAHYTLDTWIAAGARVQYQRDEDYVFAGLQANTLVKRWNKPDSQANVYAYAGIGSVFDDADSQVKRDRDTGMFVGFSADYETRRWFTSIKAEHWNNGDFGDFSNIHGRVGVAPYVANTGALHTWFMLEVHNRPENQDRRDRLGASALVRFFKGADLFEIGIDDTGEPLLNYIHRF